MPRGKVDKLWHKEWSSYGCALAYLKALCTAQLVLAIPCIVAQILLFLRCNQRWECIVYPTSVSSVLYLVGGCIGIAGLAKRQKALLATYLVIGNAAILAQVVLAILSRETIYAQFWGLLRNELSIPTVHACFLLVFSASELLLFTCSTLTALVALSRFHPAFKDKALGFKTSTVRRKELWPEPEPKPRAGFD